MKNAKRILALFLAAMMVVMAFAVPAMAASRVDSSAGTKEKLESYLYRILDKLVDMLGKTLNMLIPGLNWTNRWPTAKNYTPQYFYEGENSFDTEVQPNARWSAGFSTNSLIEGLDIMNGEYYMAGTLEAMEGRVPVEVIDDMAVCAYALSDGVSGTVVHAVIDGYGIARGDVLEIRKLLDDFAKANDVISINVSVLHQHSCIDILGMGAPLVPAVFTNPAYSLLNKDTDEFVGGKNPEFMKHLYEVTAQTVTEAVESMEGGQLYYGYVDVSDYIHDKRDPQVYDPNMNRIRFVPDNESAEEIWICEAGIHCVGLGAGADRITSDFPYYLKQYIKENAHANVVYVNGAELALTTDYTLIHQMEDEPENHMLAMGETLAKKIIAIDNDVLLPPVLNIRHKEVAIKAENQILILAVREGLINSVVAKDGLGFTIITEIGYMELGNKIGIFFTPGEISPEVFWGGATTAEESWTGESWDYAPLAETAGVDTALCFGLCNDQIGYILTDNDIRSIFTENEEVNASSYHSASTLTKAYEELLAEVK